MKRILRFFGLWKRESQQSAPIPHVYTDKFFDEHRQANEDMEMGLAIDMCVNKAVYEWEMAAVKSIHAGFDLTLGMQFIGPLQASYTVFDEDSAKYLKERPSDIVYRRFNELKKASPFFEDMEKVMKKTYWAHGT